MTELPVSPAGRRYGYLRDKPDFRDLGIARLLRKRKINPPEVDLKKFCGPMKDQKDLGACTGFAKTSHRELLYRVQYKYEKTQIKNPVFSPLFCYWKSREKMGTITEDSGSDGRTTCQVINESGVCLETTDPYNPTDFTRPPSEAQIAEALKFRAGAYHRLQSVDDMKSCLASTYSFEVGFSVYDSFENGKWTVMPIPDTGNETLLGGHEVHFFGYSDKKAAFHVQNSWGENWAEDGDFWFPYHAAANPDILQDAWIQHLGPAW